MTCSVYFSFQQSSEVLLAEKDMEIEMLKDHIEVLLDEQESLQKAQQTEGSGVTILV